MSQIQISRNFLFLILTISIIAFVGCSADDDSSQAIEISVNGTILFDDGDDFDGDVDGDFTGNGGSASKTFLWRNSLNTADYNADITAANNSLFEMEVKDAGGNIVLNKTLRGGLEPDSFSGVTANGTSGIWSVTITLTSFNGDGSFSLSEGD